MDNYQNYIGVYDDIDTEEGDCFYCGSTIFDEFCDNCLNVQPEK